jgi:hypothetical protein
MDYEDFVLELGADAVGPTVRVLSSPAGEIRSRGAIARVE